MKQILLIFLLILLVGSYPVNAKQLEVKGTIVAREKSYGHIYQDDEIQTSLLIVRLENIVKGEEKSKYILVSYKWQLKDEVNPEFENQTTSWSFLLSPKKSCKSALRDLQFTFFGGQKISGIQPRFLRNIGSENEPLPFDTKLPCYESRATKVQKIVKFPETQNSAENYRPSFVIEDGLWIDHPQTPLKVFFGGIEEFTNTSNKSISEFGLGCVINPNNDFQVIKSFPVEMRGLNPNQTIFTTESTGTSASMDKLFTCFEMKAKLAAISVKFADNSVWEIK